MKTRILICAILLAALASAVPLSVSVGLSDTVANTGDVIAATVHLSADIDAMYEMRSTLPDGVELVSGATSWEGRLKKGETHDLSFDIRPVRPGSHKISGYAKATVYGNWYSAWNWNMLFVSGQSLEKPTEVTLAVNAPKKANVTDSVPVEVLVSSNAAVEASATITMSDNSAEFVSVEPPTVLVEGNKLRWDGEVDGEFVISFSVKFKEPGFKHVNVLVRHGSTELARRADIEVVKTEEEPAPQPPEQVKNEVVEQPPIAQPPANNATTPQAQRQDYTIYYVIAIVIIVVVVAVVVLLILRLRH